MKKENQISINKVHVGLFVVCFNLAANSNGISPLLGSGFSSILSKKIYVFYDGWVTRLQHINNNKHGYNADPQQSKSLMNWLFFLMTGYYQINNRDFSAAFLQGKKVAIRLCGVKY